MLGPVAWAGTPFGNRNAFTDLAGSMELWFRGLGDAIHALTGVSTYTPPIGAGIGSPAWLLSVQQMVQSACAALQIAPPPDLASFDLRAQDDFTSWVYVMSQQGERLRLAAGLP